MANLDPTIPRPSNGDGASLSDRPTAKYAGVRTDAGITVAREDDAGKVFPLKLRHDLRMHADGFEWGYAGGGPAQLALAILSDVVGADEASVCYQRFKFEVVAKLPKERWELSREEVLWWYRRWLAVDRSDPHDDVRPGNEPTDG
jgi:hypothetical protein